MQVLFSFYFYYLLLKGNRMKNDTLTRSSSLLYFFEIVKMVSFMRFISLFISSLNSKEICILFYYSYVNYHNHHHYLYLLNHSFHSLLMLNDFPPLYYFFFLIMFCSLKLVNNQWKAKMINKDLSKKKFDPLHVINVIQ